MKSFEVQASRLALVLVALLTGSCSLVVDPDVESIGSPPPTCMPGVVHDDCACLGGTQGFQVCNADGYFDPCQCGASGAGG